MTTLNNDELREQILEALLGADADSEELYVDTKAKFLIDDLMQLIATHDQQLLEAILEGLRGKVIPYNTDGERYLAETLCRDFEEHIKSVFKKEGE